MQTAQSILEIASAVWDGSIAAQYTLLLHNHKQYKTKYCPSITNSYEPPYVFKHV